MLSSQLNLSASEADESKGTHKYHGLNWHKHVQKFQARVFHQGHAYSLGYYTVAADAALAYDKAVAALNLDDMLQKHFATFKDYQSARELEIVQRSDISNAKSAEEMTKEIDEKVAQKCGTEHQGTYKYHGLNWHKHAQKFQARVRHQGYAYSVGYYTVAADAALAYDKAVAALNLDAVLQKNFATFKDYQRARELEIEQRSDISNAKSAEEMAKEIDEKVAQKTGASLIAGLEAGHFHSKRPELDEGKCRG
jgi:type IV pilus biogenesis protein CpaD/CtpE